MFIDIIFQNARNIFYQFNIKRHVVGIFGLVCVGKKVLGDFRTHSGFLNELYLF